MRSLNLAALGIGSSAAVLGTQTALAGPQIREVIVPVSGLHPDCTTLGF